MMEIATQRNPPQIRLRSRRAIQVTTIENALEQQQQQHEKINKPKNSNNILNRNKIICIILMW